MPGRQAETGPSELPWSLLLSLVFGHPGPQGTFGSQPDPFLHSSLLSPRPAQPDLATKETARLDNHGLRRGGRIEIEG